MLFQLLAPPPQPIVVGSSAVHIKHIDKACAKRAREEKVQKLIPVFERNVEESEDLSKVAKLMCEQASLEAEQLGLEFTAPGTSAYHSAVGEELELATDYAAKAKANAVAAESKSACAKQRLAFLFRAAD